MTDELKDKKDKRRRYYEGLLYLPPDKGKERSPQNIFDRNMHSAHLRAYLKGWKNFFYHGHQFPVLESWR